MNTVRQLCFCHPELLEYDYKWIDSDLYKPIDEAILKYGYELVDAEIVGEYNDIKAYYNCEIRLIK